MDQIIWKLTRQTLCEPYMHQYKGYNTCTESLTLKEERKDAEKGISGRENI